MSVAIFSFLFLILFELHHFFQLSEGIPTADKNEAIDIQFKLSIPLCIHSPWVEATLHRNCFDNKRP